jgi:thiol:disulfide interchange protein DsbD
LTAFFVGILGGLAALFFPCTFPMIPMTMSFFLKGSEQGKGTRNAILYGFCIFLVYFLLSLPFHFGLGGAALNNFSTNVWVNLIFFVIFIFFSFSLFGFYDISLPASLGNKLDSKSGTGTFIGIFFMAFTLAIVSFSCTGPILGLVLASAKNSAFITPAFSGFGIGLGVPFAIFALFPKLLKNLPKSGSWLDVVKVIFGFIELAFAFKFLSNADLVERWGILKREPFVLIWIAVFILQGLYLIGLFKFKKESIIKKTPITWALAIVSFLFVGYLATDFFGGELLAGQTSHHGGRTPNIAARERDDSTRTHGAERCRDRVAAGFITHEGPVLLDQSGAGRKAVRGREPGEFAGPQSAA